MRRSRRGSGLCAARSASSSDSYSADLCLQRPGQTCASVQDPPTTPIMTLERTAPLCVKASGPERCRSLTHPYRAADRGRCRTVRSCPAGARGGADDLGEPVWEVSAEAGSGDDVGDADANRGEAFPYE
jgi:hypothetical protein